MRFASEFNNKESLEKYFVRLTLYSMSRLCCEHDVCLSICLQHRAVSASAGLHVACCKEKGCFLKGGVAKYLAHHVELGSNNLIESDSSP